MINVYCLMFIAGFMFMVVFIYDPGLILEGIFKVIYKIMDCTKPKGAHFK